MTRLECCMCGDYGFSDELFQCKSCHFRSQHRYCSNLYPKAESYRICNWCLTTQKDISSDTTEQKLSTQNSSCSSKNDVESEDIKSSKKLRVTKSDDLDNRLNRSAVNRQSQRTQPDLVVQVNRSDERRRSPERSPAVRKRIITRGALEEKLRRTTSEDVFSGKSNINNENNFIGIINNNNNNTNNNNNKGNYHHNTSVITRHVFRNKVRRYKSLDEVSS